MTLRNILQMINMAESDYTLTELTPVAGIDGDEIQVNDQMTICIICEKSIGVLECFECSKCYGFIHSDCVKIPRKVQKLSALFALKKRIFAQGKTFPLSV